MSSGRYQSRLFNFVYQQSRRVTQHLHSASRHLQVAAIWGVQIILSPLYLLFQSTESAGKQLHSSSKQSLLQLPANHPDSQPQTPPTADTPIQQVLRLVDSLPSQEPANFLTFFVSNALKRFNFFLHSPKNTSNLTHSSSPISEKLKESNLILTKKSLLSTRNCPIVRGIATQLSSRTLVLVTAQNQILDILTTQQQQKLQQRIIGEVAKYWRYQRLAHLGRQEAELILQPDSAIAFLDRTVANLESAHLAPVSKTALSVTLAVAQRSRAIAQVIQTHLTMSFGGKSSLHSQDSEARTIKIQALIWAAIDYFFGDHRGLPLEQNRQTQKPLLNRRFVFKLPYSSQLISTDVDPWLSESDLFGDLEAESKQTIFAQPQTLIHKTKQALPSSHLIKYSWQKMSDRFQRFLPQLKQASELVKRQKTTHSVIETHKTANNAALIFGKGDYSSIATPKTTLSPVSQHRQESTSKISNQVHSQSTEIDPAPDWIETHATAIGYVKHPLEQLLALLDRVMLWLEELLMKILQWIQQLWQGK